MAQLWTIAEQQSIKPIENTRLFPQLQIEVEVNDVQKYLGREFFQELKRNPNTYTTLLAGGSYEKDGITYTFTGLKHFFAYLLYARYVRQSYINDTQSGLVVHTGDGFSGLSGAELKNQEDRYQNIAGAVWVECKDYLCTLDLDYFPEREQTTFKLDVL